MFPCMHIAWRARLLYQMGPPCKCVTPDATFCVVMWHLLRVFVLFRSCSSEIYRTQKTTVEQGYHNMRVRCIVSLLLSLVDGQIWHLRTINRRADLALATALRRAAPSLPAVRPRRAGLGPFSCGSGVQGPAPSLPVARLPHPYIVGSASLRRLQPRLRWLAANTATGQEAEIHGG